MKKSGLSIAEMLLVELETRSWLRTVLIDPWSLCGPWGKSQARLQYVGLCCCSQNWSWWGVAANKTTPTAAAWQALHLHPLNRIS